MDNLIRSILGQYGRVPSMAGPDPLGSQSRGDDSSMELLRRLGAGTRSVADTMGYGPMVQPYSASEPPAMSSGLGGGMGFPPSRLRMLGD